MTMNGKDGECSPNPNGFKLQNGCDLLCSGRTLLESKERFDDRYREDFLNHTNSQSSNDALFPNPTVGEVDRACRIALKTHFNLRLLQSERENQESIEYLEKVFSKTPSFSEYLANARKEGSTLKQIALKCEVIRGSSLSPKGSGKCNPYCKLVILDKKHIGAKVVQKGDISDWVVEGIIGEGSVSQSMSKSSAVDPEWGELFELDLINPQEEYLVVEAWGSDDQDRKEKVKGRKGFGNLLEDLKNDGFIGRAFYLLKHLPVSGGEKVLELHSHSGKHCRGSLTVHLDIVDKGEFIPDDEKTTQFTEVLKVVLAHESKKGGDQYTKIWNGRLTDTAEKLLTRYIMLWRLSKMCAAAVRFSMLMEYHRSYVISMSALESVITEIRQCNSERREDIQPDWVLKLMRDIQELHSYISDVMKNHLEKFSFKSESNIHELKAHLLTLRAIYSSKVFLNEPDQNEEDKYFSEAVMSAIQIAVPTWFLALSANLMRPIGNEALGFKALCSHCLKQCHRVIKGVQPAFREAGIDYFSPFFFALDKLLYTEVESALLSNRSNDSFLLSYEIYRLLHDLKTFSGYVDSRFLSSQNATYLHISKYNQWFRGLVSRWIELAQSKARKKLLDSVTSDMAVENTKGLYFSSSSVDARYVLNQMTSFWKDLDWPDREQSIGYFIATVQVINDLAIYYADLIFQKLKGDDQVQCDKESSVVIADKLCIALNNVSLVKSVLLEIGQNLDLDSYYKWLDEKDVEKGSQQLSKKAKDLWIRVLGSADQDIQHKKDHIAGQVIAQIVPTINTLLSNALEADHNVPSETVFEPLLDYMAKNVGKLGQALLRPTFLSILEDLWCDCIQLLRKWYKVLIQDSSSRSRLSRLKELLFTLSGLFRGDGSGLSSELVETQQYMLLMMELKLSAMATQQLIRVFLQDLVKQQEDATLDLGVLRFSHLYNKEENILKICVVSVHGIPELDKTGKKKLFVEVWLLPADMFHEAAKKNYKTDAKNQTVDLFFNSNFDIPAERYKLKEDGALILLAMFDTRMKAKIEFAGLCVVKCDSTPQETELKMEYLNLFHYKQTIAYEELERRSSENLANDFLKLLKRLTPENIPSLQLPSTSGVGHFVQLIKNTW